MGPRGLGDVVVLPSHSTFQEVTSSVESAGIDWDPKGPQLALGLETGVIQAIVLLLKSWNLSDKRGFFYFLIK